MTVRRLALLLALLAIPNYAGADSVVITSGSAGANADSSRTGWQLLGENTDLRGENFASARSFDSGTLVDMSQVISIFQDACCPRQETVQGTTYDRVFLTGSMSFSTPSFTAPTAPQNTFTIFEQPFTMVGHISGFLTMDFSGIPQFSVDVTGSGTAFLGPMRAITTDEGTAWLNTAGLTYRFAATDTGTPSPTPEPATLVLLASGVVVSALRRRSTS